MTGGGFAPDPADCQGPDSRDYHETCDQLTWDLNATRQSLGLSLGVSTPLCVTILKVCVAKYEGKGDLPGPVMAVYIAADNPYTCL